MDIRLAQPFNPIDSGSTCSGKSVFTLKPIEHAQEVISSPPDHILFCYGEYIKNLIANPELNFPTDCRRKAPLMERNERFW